MKAEFSENQANANLVTPTLTAATDQHSATTPASSDGSPPLDEVMIRKRLGLHASLFQALRVKHAASASHCLRVALGCSKWAAWSNIDEEDRNHLEVAALLHDLGKIGVPDFILEKPDPLSDAERKYVASQRRAAQEMIALAGGEQKLLDILNAARLHFAQAQEEGVANRLSSMLTIMDAYDSMISEQVFRRPMSRESALEELCLCAGTQFDPELVRDFAVLISQPREDLEQALAERWLTLLGDADTPGFGVPSLGTGAIASRGGGQSDDELTMDRIFHCSLLDSLSDAAVYLDVNGKILTWNRGAEQLAGLQASTLLDKRWSSASVGLYDINGNALNDKQCPLFRIASTNAQFQDQYMLRSKNGEECIVSLKAAPIFGKDRHRCGAILLMRDASEQASLQEKVASWRAMAIIDPLTKVANRAELTRRMPDFVREHLGEGRSGSVIMCDIDYFKKINDSYGHQAGDDALVTFAGMLQELARKDDLIARYGGEEFIILCPNCDNSAATSRAEQMRMKVHATPVPALEGRNMTCSFGVTEVQPGDTDDTLLARADRALMTAKQNGRNCVIQLGSGQRTAADLVAADEQTPSEHDSAHQESSRNSWLSWFSGETAALVNCEYLAAVPREVAIQKLQGFIVDHKAELVSASESQVVIKVDSTMANGRRGERPTCMILTVDVTSVKMASAKVGVGTYQERTKFSVEVKPHRARDRRSDVLKGQANQLLASFRAYLVAQEIDDELSKLVIEPR